MILDTAPADMGRFVSTALVRAAIALALSWVQRLKLRNLWALIYMDNLTKLIPVK